MAKQIVKIVLCSVAALVLTALLAGLLLLSATDLLPQFDWQNLRISFYDDAEYRIGGGELTLEQTTALQGLKIEWLGGKVEVRYYDGDTLRFSEPEGLDEDERLRWKMENGTLTILPCKSSFFSSFVCGEKTLEIQIPKSLFYTDFLDSSVSSVLFPGTSNRALNLDIQTVSADIFLEGLQLNALSVKSASGNCRMEDASDDVLSAWVDSLEVELTSGSLTLVDYRVNQGKTASVSGEISIRSGSFSTLEIEQVSGETTLEDVYIYEHFSFDSVSGDLRASLNPWDEETPLTALRAATTSGDVTLCLPRDAAFAARLSSTSGDLTVDTGFGEVVSSDDGRSYTVNQGGVELEFSSVSGDVNILPN